MIEAIAQLLVSIGAMNWGLTKFFKLNLVEYLGNMVKVDYLKEALYGIISIAGLFTLIKIFV